VKLIRPVGSTSQTIGLFIRNNSVTTGVGLTGLAYNTAGLTAYYWIAGANAPVSIALATLASDTTAYSSGGFLDLSTSGAGAAVAGLYRFDVPNAVLASVGAAYVILLGAANMEPCTIEFQVSGLSLDDGVRAGLTALPNVAVGTRGQILTDSDVIETQGSITVQQALSTMLAALAGVTSSNGSVIASPNGGATRITATVTAANNRTAMTLTPSS
jgi:hypothetical protein